MLDQRCDLVCILCSYCRESTGTTSRKIFLSCLLLLSSFPPISSGNELERRLPDLRLCVKFEERECDVGAEECYVLILERVEEEQACELLSDIMLAILNKFGRNRKQPTID